LRTDRYDGTARSYSAGYCRFGRHHSIADRNSRRSRTHSDADGNGRRADTDAYANRGSRYAYADSDANSNGGRGDPNSCGCFNIRTVARPGSETRGSLYVL